MEFLIDLISTDGVQALVLGVLGWLGMKVSKWLTSQTDNEKAKGVLLRLNDAVFGTVMQLEQTLVAEIKAVNADGKLSAEEKKQVRDLAIDLVRDQLGPKGLEKAAKILGLDMRIDEFIGNRVESEIGKAKHAERIAGAIRTAEDNSAAARLDPKKAAEGLLERNP